MKRSFLILMCFSFILSFGSCQLPDAEIEKAPKSRSIEEDLEIVKKYMSIDKEKNQYSITIEEEERLKEGISLSNLNYILGDIAALNQKVGESIRAGAVVTLYLTTNSTFEAYTPNQNFKSGIGFKDIRVPIDKKVTTRGPFLSSVSFSSGNWSYTSGNSFTGSDQVTSAVYVNNSIGYWQVSYTCNTGTSAYGTSHVAYGTGSTSGSIKRFWWWTDGGSSPFRWSFSLGGPPGGEANGGITFTNTY